MGTMVIDRKNTELRYESGRVKVYETGKFSTSVPVSLIDHLIIYRHATMNTGILSALADKGAALTVIDPYREQRTACLTGVQYKNSARRLAQYDAYFNAEWRLQWSKKLISRKIKSQLIFLADVLDQRKDLRFPLTKAQKSLIYAIESLSHIQKIDSIRGIEGAAAAAYFRGYKKLFAPSLEFNARNRRPPLDPVNACLSLSYTLAHSETIKALRSVGLDPMIGFYHELSYGRESLACDLVELHRPSIDQWVWEQFRSRFLRPESFTMNKSQCLLGKAGRHSFYKNFEAFACSLRTRLRRVLNYLTHNLEATVIPVDDIES